MSRSVPISPMSPMNQAMNSPLSSLTSMSSMSPLSSLSSLSSMVGQPNQSLAGAPKNVPGMGPGKFAFFLEFKSNVWWALLNPTTFFYLKRHDESSTWPQYATAISTSNATTKTATANATVTNTSNDTNWHVSTGTFLIPGLVDLNSPKQSKSNSNSTTPPIVSKPFTQTNPNGPPNMMIKNEGAPQFDGPMMAKNDTMPNQANFDVGNNMMLKNEPLPNFDTANASMQQPNMGANLPLNTMHPLSNVIKQVFHH